MEQWGNRPEVGKLVEALHEVADENDILLKRANINLENSWVLFGLYAKTPRSLPLPFEADRDTKIPASTSRMIPALDSRP